VASVLSDASGYATFPTELLQGSYTIGITHASYQMSAAQNLVVGTTDARLSLTLAVKPSTVTATRSTKGTVYVWNASGTLNTSMASASSKPYTAVFTLTNPDIQPKVYYFTSVNAFSTATSTTVSPGQSYAVTVP
jgi:hypothetical protein